MYVPYCRVFFEVVYYSRCGKEVEYTSVQSVARGGVSFNLNLQSQSHWSLFHWTFNLNLQSQLHWSLFHWTFNLNLQSQSHWSLFHWTFNLNLQSLSHWSLFHGTWQKRPRGLDNRKRFETAEITLLTQWGLKGGEDPEDALSCRSFLAKEPLLIGLFCGKWPIKIRHPMTLRHPVLGRYL